CRSRPLTAQAEHVEALGGGEELVDRAGAGARSVGRRSGIGAVGAVGCDSRGSLVPRAAGMLGDPQRRGPGGGGLDRSPPLGEAAQLLLAGVGGPPPRDHLRRQPGPGRARPRAAPGRGGAAAPRGRRRPAATRSPAATARTRRSWAAPSRPRGASGPPGPGTRAPAPPRAPRCGRGRSVSRSRRGSGRGPRGAPRPRSPHPARGPPRCAGRVRARRLLGSAGLRATVSVVPDPTPSSSRPGLGVGPSPGTTRASPRRPTYGVTGSNDAPSPRRSPLTMALTPYPASDFPETPAAIVTGAASERGIGRATAHRLAREGWAVAVLDLDGDASAQVAEQITREHGTPALGLGVDIADEQAVIEAVRRVDEELPQLVGVVNNAGISSPTPFTEVSTEEWKRVFDVNVHGTFFVTREAVSVFRRHCLGR